MKKYFLLLLLLANLQILLPNFIFSQDYWTAPLRLTSGFIDKNPQFGSKTHLYRDYNFGNELCVFERHISNYSQICVMNFDANSMVDSVVYLTTNNFLKQNPTISYARSINTLNSPVRNGLVIWESYENGKWDLFSRYYFNGVWQNIKPFDTSAGNKSGVNIYCYDSLKYAIAYEKNGDIIFKWYDALNDNVLYDTNLTANDTSFCTNPHLALLNYNPYSSSKVFITYEKRKPNNDRAVYYKTTTNLVNWTLQDTVAYVGDNTVSSIKIIFYNNFNVFFESNRGGKYNLFTTSFDYQNSVYQYKTLDYENYNLYRTSNLEFIHIPIITDMIPSVVNAYVRKGNDGTKVLLDWYNYSIYRDSVLIGDSSKTVRITMNSGIYSPNWYIMTWVVYNKDSAGYTNLYAKRRRAQMTDIIQIGNLVPDKYSLEQNYPNPFNPVTKIVFSVPKSENVSLKIFDILGREKENLINKKMNPGTYEIIFDGSKYSSGIYFYSLQTGNYSDTKKMVILK